MSLNETQQNEIDWKPTKLEREISKNKNSVQSLNVLKQYLGPCKCTRRKCSHLLVGHGEFGARKKMQKCKSSSDSRKELFSQVADMGPCFWRNSGTGSHTGKVSFTLPFSAQFILASDKWRLQVSHSFFSKWKIFCFTDFLALLVHHADNFPRPDGQKCKQIHIFNLSWMELLKKDFGWFSAGRDYRMVENVRIKPRVQRPERILESFVTEFPILINIHSLPE